MQFYFLPDFFIPLPPEGKYKRLTLIYNKHLINRSVSQHFHSPSSVITLSNNITNTHTGDIHNVRASVHESGR